MFLEIINTEQLKGEFSEINRSLTCESDDLKENCLSDFRLAFKYS